MIRSAHRWERRLRRLPQIGVSGLAGRSRQKATAWLERWLAGASNGTSESLARELEDELGGSADAARRLPHALEGMRDAAPGRFFAGATEVPAEPGSSTDASDPILAHADRLCAGRFDLLGYRGLLFGDPVDWHLDPVSGRRAPLIHWSRIDPLDSAQVGDSKVIWELNRHQWMVRLGQAYRFTGDELYAHTFAAAIRAWNRENPPGMGLNWASSLELSFRLISWCWCLLLFRGSAQLDDALYAEILGGVAGHAAHVEKYLSFYFSPNTHLTGEALGLFYAGTLFRELRSAERWRSTGARILLEELERQVHADGVHFEQSTCYQRYTVEIYLHFLILAERNGVGVPGEFRDKLQRMLDYLLALRRPDGSMPTIGDADGGSLLSLFPRGPDDFRGVFAVGAALFGRDDYAWAAGERAEEAEWLLGRAGREDFASLSPAPPAGEPASVFPDGGYVIFRHGLDEDGDQLIFDVGPLGCDISGGHGHADLLSIQLAVHGEPYLVDPGTYRYTFAEGFRDHFRRTAAHSTLRVDGRDQARPDGSFGWQSRPRARLRSVELAAPVPFVEAEHDAYEGVLHRRRVLFVPGAYTVLVDDVEGANEHDVELRFQFAPLRITLEASLWARAVGLRGGALLVRTLATIPLEGAIYEGELSPLEGWFSSDYGRREPAPLLLYSARARLPLRLVTLLVPVPNAHTSPPRADLLLDRTQRPTGIELPGGDRLLFEGGVTEASRSRRPAPGESLV